jgi:hypothetical protein
MKNVLGVQTTAGHFFNIFGGLRLPEIEIEDCGIEVVDGQEYNFFNLNAGDLHKDTVKSIEDAFVEENVSFTWDYPY